MTTKVKALDRLIDAIAGSDVPVAAQTVAGTIDALADTLAGSDVTFTAQDIAGRLDELAKMVEDGTIVIGGGGWNVPNSQLDLSFQNYAQSTIETAYVFADSFDAAISEYFEGYKFNSFNIGSQGHMSFAAKGIILFAINDITSGLYSVTIQEYDGTSTRLISTTSINASTSTDTMRVYTAGDESYRLMLDLAKLDALRESDTGYIMVSVKKRDR